MKPIILSLGGSLIVQEEIDINFLKHFKKFIMKFLKRGQRFIIVCGGGRTCRKYQKAAKTFKDVPQEELDWIGIKTTCLNASLLKAIFSKLAFPRIVETPLEKIKFKEKILFASGWRPGCSSDKDAVLLARNFGVQKIVNLTNIDYVYDKDPNLFKNAKPIKQISWHDFRRNVLPKKWVPGINAPFDPIASKEAQKMGLEVIILNGRNLKNLENYLLGKNFSGTVVR